MTQADQHDGDQTLGKVVWGATMSLDGFIADRDDDMDWVFEYASFANPVVVESI
jgi:hypothetical protein